MPPALVDPRIAAEKATSRKAGDFWGTCRKENVADLPFLKDRRIKAHGLRVGPGGEFDPSLRDVECLIMAVRQAPGSKSAPTLQAIAPDGEVYHYPGILTDGSYSLIGSDKGKQPIVFCADFASGAAIHEATGYPVVLCLYPANMMRVAVWAPAHWAGREMIVAAVDATYASDPGDADRARKAAFDMARELGASVAVPALHGVMGSTFNDQALEYDLASVKDAIDAARDPDAPEVIEPIDVAQPEYLDAGIDYEPDPERPTLDLISPSSWAGRIVPVRQWRLQDLVPHGQATLFTGAGAVGKSLANQQMTSAIALSQTFLGVRTFSCPALYITCEDDADELQRRQAAICHAMGVSLEATDGRVFLLSLYGELNNALCTWDDRGNLVISDRYHSIVETCRKHGIQHVTLDNTAHFFIGNEIVRSEVAGFVNLCNRMARDIGGTVVIVGHPNKSGDSYSGSTAWENQVRSRIFMDTPKSADGTIVDPDLRLMRNEKANYAQRDNEIRFYWHKGAFVLEGQLGKDESQPKGQSQPFTGDDSTFLRLLEKLTKERRNVSHAARAGNYAPKVMAGMPAARGVSLGRLHAAMERLFADEIIEASQPLWLDEHRHPVVGISRKEKPE